MTPAPTPHTGSTTGAPLAMLLVAGLLGSVLAVTPLGSPAPAHAAADSAISGTVSADGDGGVAPLAEAHVRLLDRSGTQMRLERTGQDGSFEMTGLAAGSYTLLVIDNNQDYLTEWWQNQLQYSTATYFDLAAGTAQTGFDVTLARASSISGTVVVPGSPTTPLAGVTVSAVNSSGDASNVATDENGNYTIRGLSAQSYKVRFWPYGTPYAIEWWTDQASEATAATVTVAAGQTASGINAVLELSASLSGTVSSGSAGVGEVVVTAYDTAGAEAGSSSADGAGRYTLPDLHAGSYALEFTAYTDDGPIVEWWNDQPTRSTATTVSVTAGQNRTGLDANIGTHALTAAPVPTITGTPLVGAALTAVAGSWAPAPVTLSYQWARAGVPIAGATGRTYKPVTADAGATLTVVVTGAKPGYTPQAKVSKATAQVTGAALTVTPVPTLSGTARVGQTLTVKPGTWAPAPVALGYQWLRGKTVIPSASKSSYTLVAADAGKAITVKVTGTRRGFTTVAKSSAATATVTQLLTGTPKPTIAGTAKVGQTLAAKAGSWTPAPVTLKYQWSRAGKAIPGATASTYKPTKADAGTTLTVAVTGTKAGYVTVVKTSAVTAMVTGGSLATVPVPTVAGTAKVGQTLTAKAGTWAPAPVTLRYQWLRGGTAISGATKSTYKSVAADIGKALTVKVTGAKPGFTTVAKTSAVTAKVVR